MLHQDIRQEKCRALCCCKKTIAPPKSTLRINFSMEACPICSFLSLSAPKSTSTQLYRIRELRKSAKRGCHSCMLLFDGVLAFSGDRDTASTDSRLFKVNLEHKPYWYRRKSDAVRRLVLSFWGNKSTDGPRWIEFWVQKGSC